MIDIYPEYWIRELYQHQHILSLMNIKCLIDKLYIGGMAMTFLSSKKLPCSANMCDSEGDLFMDHRLDAMLHDIYLSIW